MPVSMEARLAALIGVDENAFRKQVPSLARRSIWGVCIIVLPAYPSASQRWSSVSMKMMLGVCFADFAEAGVFAATGMAFSPPHTMHERTEQYFRLRFAFM